MQMLQDVFAPLGGSFFAGLAISGNSIDLDGSTGVAATFTSQSLSLPAGQYKVDFDYTGNNRGGSADTAIVSLDGASVTLG